MVDGQNFNPPEACLAGIPFQNLGAHDRASLRRRLLDHPCWEALTGVIDRLEKAGYIRVFAIQMTAAG